MNLLNRTIIPLLAVTSMLLAACSQTTDTESGGTLGQCAGDAACPIGQECVGKVKIIQ